MLKRVENALPPARYSKRWRSQARSSTHFFDFTVQAGTIVEFLQKSDLMVGVCLLSTPQHIRVLAENNKELNLNERKIINILKKTLPVSMSRLDRVSALKDWSSQFQETDSEFDLQTLWEVLAGETESMDLGTIAEMYFSEPSDYERSQLLRSLLADRIYFERKGEDKFCARSADTVNQIQAQQRREEEKRMSRQVMAQWILACDKSPTPPPETIQSSIQLIQEVAVMGRRSGNYNNVSQFFDEAGLASTSLEDRCLRLLIRSGIWDEDINLSLIEQQVPLEFSKDLLASVAQISVVSNECPESRKDLRFLETLTIDDAETTDIDDAISWESNTEGGYRLWVHIADASAYVLPDTALDQEAAKRFTSIYLCERKIEMLPPHLSQNICSLVAGEPRLALSVAFELNSEFDIQSASIHETLIEVKQRMSYDQVDQSLESNPLLQTLLKLAHHHRDQRLARGAIEFNRPELRIKVNAEKKISLKQVERDSPAQLLVSELMILANHWVAKILSEVRIPLIYKTQDPPTEENAQGRPLLKRAEMTVRPGAHYGLGLDVYTQFTSPIRRYNDLILHRQIKHWLHTQTSQYNEEEIQKLIALSEQAVFSANFIQRENYRYWLYKYFQNLPTPRIFPARINSISNEKTFVHLPDFCFDTLFPAGDVVDLREGNEFWLEIVQANPRKGLLQLRRVAAPQTEE
jgi:exoribonuclease II